MIKCVILDDEPLAHHVLEYYIAQTPALVLTAAYRNAVEAFEYLNRNQADILFLDIEMPLVNGIAFLKALPNAPKTIFTTAYKQYAFDGFELNAVDYLLKPFSYERFMKAVTKTGYLEEPVPTIAVTLMIKDKGALLQLKQQNIIYIEGCKDYIKIITAEKTHIIYHTLKHILEKLDEQLFIQTHRSYIVNSSFVNRIQTDELILNNQTFIPIGKTYKKGLISKLKQ